MQIWGEPHTEAMGNGLFEMRLKASEGIARVFYCTLVGKRIVMLHSFVKKTPKIPPREFICGVSDETGQRFKKLMRPCMVSLKSSKSILKYSLSDGEHSPDGEPLERQRMAAQANLTLPVSSLLSACAILIVKVLNRMTDNFKCWYMFTMMPLTNQILIGILALYWLWSWLYAELIDLIKWAFSLVRHHPFLREFHRVFPRYLTRYLADLASHSGCQGLM